MTSTIKIAPQLRFPEFQEDWQERKLGEIAKFSRGKGISKADISENGDTECIRYGELYTEYREIISEIKSKTNVEKEDLVLSEYNDVIIPASGETQLDIATASCVLKSGVALGGDLNIIRTINNGIFLSYYLNSKKKLEIASLAQGISVVHLYGNQLSLLPISFPALPEQNKIANFLTSVDEKIQALSKKKELVQQYKKGIMQRIFSQELRFNDEYGQPFPDWEEKKLEELAFKVSSNIAANTIEENNGNFIIYGASGELKKVDFYREETEYISIVKDGAGVGRVFLCMAKTSVLGTMDIIKPKEGNLHFLFYFLQQFDFQKYITGSTIPHIYFSDYKLVLVSIPSLPEQTKIANFLLAIDERIAMIDTQLQKAEAWKKGLLQKMFC